MADLLRARRSDDETRSLSSLHFFAFAAALEWSIYLPSLPFLLVNAVGAPVSSVGLLLATFAAASLLSFLLHPYIHMGLPHVSTRSWLLLVLAFRSLSGGLHVAACKLASQAESQADMVLALLFTSRALHGIGASSFAISLAWVGAAIPQHHRPQVPLAVSVAWRQYWLARRLLNGVCTSLRRLHSLTARPSSAH